MGRIATWCISLLAAVAMTGNVLLAHPNPPPASPGLTGPFISAQPKRMGVAKGGVPVKPFISVPRTQNSKALSSAIRASKARLGAAVIKNQRFRILSFARTPSPTGCAVASGFPAPIATLAASLKCDPDLIFEYVYNNIEFEQQYGSNKGPLGTLLDRRGDDADQVQLLVTLWNAAGLTQTGYYNNPLTLNGTQIANWFGVPNDCSAIQSLLNAGGIIYSNAVCNGDGTLNSINVNHFFAALQLGGTWYYFDPSFKFHTILTGVSGIASVMGYSRTQFLSDASGVVGTYSISSVNRAQIRTDLTSYATNLLNYINANNRTWTVGNVIGGKIIQPLTGSPIRITQPTWSPSASFPVDCPNQTPTSVECRTYITITMPGASSSQAIKLYTDQVYGHRITVFSVPSGTNFVATLLIDGAVPACVGLGTCTNVGLPQSGGTNATIATQIVEPNQPSSPNCATGITECQDLSIVVGTNGSYLISLGSGQVGRGMAEYHRQLLAAARAAGNPDTSEPVLGENLAAISYNWLAESSSQQQITDQFTQSTRLYHFGIGITAQANILTFGYQGPYVDLPMNYFHAQCWYSTCPTISVGGNTYPASFIASTYATAQTESVLESGVLLQTQAPVGNMTAASTMTLVDANMNPSYPGSGDTTYLADGTTTAGKNYFNNTIYPAISPYYNSNDLSAISADVNGGAQLLIPSRGQLGVGLWQGAGYTATVLLSTSEIGVFQLITGGMAGGFSGTDITNPAPFTEQTLIGAADINSLQDLINTIPSTFDPQSFEPVDSVTGAYIYTHNDMTTGSGSFPYALPFSRTYLSSSGGYLSTTMADIGIGNGWAHAYSATALVNSDPYIGIGSTDSPAATAVTSLAALYVMQDLMSVTPSAQTMTLSSMVAQWFSDQLTSNIVLVSQPNTTEEFAALPHNDGSTSFGFNAPPGSSVRLTQTASGQYTYAQKDGVTLNFGTTPTGALQSWVYPNGMIVNLSYTGSQLTKVTNNLGRSLTFGYTGNDITSVTDDTNRSISYGYDANHNLTSFTDPLSAITKFVYDASGTYDTQGHLTQVFYPTNPTTPFVTNTYDPMGRVAFQANANGEVSDFYIAGSRTELVDALGDRNVTYQTDLGRVTKNAWVLSGAADVFNDTPQQNGVVNVWSNQYDGLGRLTQAIAPEGDCTTYAYATNLNPWANNVTSITRYAKPGTYSPCDAVHLASITQSFTYDPNWNKIATITDGLGLVTENIYDTTTGNLIRTIADYSPSNGHLNAASIFTYNSVGQVLTATDPLGAVTQYTYDSFGNQKTITRDYGRLNQLTSLGYSTLGDVTSVTDPNGNLTTNTYDADRRLSTVTLPSAPPAPGPLVTTYTYNADSKLIQTQQSVSGLVQRTTKTNYTVTDKPWQAIDANGNNTYYAYDADDRLATVTDPVGNVTAYAYDAMSRNVSTTMQSPVWDPSPSAKCAATVLLQQIAYTPDGMGASLTDGSFQNLGSSQPAPACTGLSGSGNTTNYSYDGFNRLSIATYPAGSGGIGTTTENYTYDADSNVLSLVTRKGDTLSFSYDTLNRMCTKTVATTAVVCTATSAPNPTTWFNHDLTGKLIAANDNSAVITAPTTAASYDTAATYDPLNHPATVSWNPVPAQTTPSVASVTFQYSYDSDNRRVNQTATNSTWWSYPAATASSLGYTANALNQYSAIGSIVPLYDADGDLVYDGTFTFDYDAQGRLTEILNGVTAVATYAYDGQGRRKEKTVGSTTTIYVADADNREVLEYSGAGALQNWYAYGLGSNDVLNQMNVASNTRETMVPDVQGSFIATLDAASGSLSNAGYQTFGENPTLTSGTFRYTGQRFDPETAGSASEPSGLYYYHARIYSPVLGRFLQPDPGGYQAGGMNLYAYVGNDPVNATDPSGMCIEDACVIEGAIVAEAVETAPVWGPALLTGAKAVVGFALGYGGATVSGVQSTQGRVAAGLVGAIGLPGTGAAVSAVGGAGYVGLGTFATGAAGSFTTGTLGSLAGQTSDYENGLIPQVSLSRALTTGATTTGAFTLFGEGALAASGVELGGTAGATVDTITTTGSTLGGFALDQLVNSSQQSSSQQSNVNFGNTNYFSTPSLSGNSSQSTSTPK